jgi:hypothetical protein
MINLNLIDLDKKKKEELAEFDKVDGGDCRFLHLPQPAQRAAFEIMAKFDSYNVIKRELDRCMDFRMAFKDILEPQGIDVESPDTYLNAVDAVMRFWQWKINSKAVA